MYREERYEFTYTINGETKRCYPQSREQVDKNRATCRERGYKVLSVKKMYPFSTERNQHNFELIRNICLNTMNDMALGDIPWDDAEFEKCEAMVDKCDQYFCLPLPIAWLTYDKWAEAKEIAVAAVIHRDQMNARRYE